MQIYRPDSDRIFGSINKNYKYILYFNDHMTSNYDLNLDCYMM